MNRIKWKEKLKMISRKLLYRFAPNLCLILCVCVIICMMEIACVQRRNTERKGVVNGETSQWKYLYIFVWHNMRERISEKTHNFK